MRALQVAAGWGYALIIVWLSLTPSPPVPGFTYGDKLGHLLAYAGLMFWFCVLYRAPRPRIAYALLWIALGVALEFAQAATGTRSFELADMGANTLGVLAGAAAARTLTRATGAA